MMNFNDLSYKAKDMYGIWQYGYYVRYNCPEEHFIIDDYHGTQIMIQEDTLSFDTGVNDMELNSTYTNDIIQDGNRIGYVSFLLGCFMAVFKEKDQENSYHVPLYTLTYKVIGNIFDDKHLLKGVFY